MARVNVKPGTPKNYVHVRCQACGYEADVDSEELFYGNKDGYFARMNLWCKCETCNCLIPVSFTSVTTEMLEKIKE